MSAPKPAPPALSVAAWSAPAMFSLMLLAALLVYGPALHGGFLWDDDGHVTRPDLQSLAGLWRIWSEPGATQQYYPFLHSAFWLEHRFWGDSVLGYHLVNVLLHATAAGLFAAVLRRLAVPGAWLAAWLFLLHPVCVESVAWISEQKNTLSLVLYLAAALAYLRFDGERSPRRYALATLFFVGALLTKTVTASLPAALLVILWWRRGRLEWRRDVRPLLPWFVLGAAGGLFTAHFERELIGAQGADFALGFLERGLLAGRTAWFYLGKLVWPADLIFIYPRWTVDASVWWQWLFPLAGLGLLAGLFAWRKRARGPLAAALLFGGSLFPVLGFFNVYPFLFSYVADHFSYLASLGFFALAGAGLARLPRPAGLAAGGVLLAACAGLSWRQAAMYRDNFTLYETTLQRNPDCWMAQLNLGAALDEAGRPTEALPHLQRALALKPDFAEILNSFGHVLNRLGRAAEARPLLEQAVRLQPRFATAHNTLGTVLMALGQTDAGLAAFLRALEISPTLTIARVNLGWALANAGRGAAAIEQLEAAVRQQPGLADAELKLGLTLAMNDRPADALPHFARAAQLEPNDVQAEFFAGASLVQLQRPAEAVPHLERALVLDENHALAHLQLALALRSLGRTAEAGEHYQAAIRLNPALAR